MGFWLSNDCCHGFKDAIEFVREYEDNSVDIFMDVCADTPFNDGGDFELPIRGLYL